MDGEIDVGGMIADQVPKERTIPPMPQATEPVIGVPVNDPPSMGSNDSTPNNGPEKFNPKIHCAGPDGKGIPIRGGGFRRKRGKKADEKAKEIADQVISDHAKFMEPPPTSTLAMVNMCVTNTMLLASTYWGEEWKLQVDEQVSICDVYARYIHYKGWDGQASPEAVVIGATAMLLLPRLLGPGFQTWLSKMMGKNNNAHSNTRSNGERKDNPSQGNREAGGEKPPQNSGDHFGPNGSQVGGTLKIRSIG